MREAVIVSYARTGLAKSNRGGFNNTHGAAMAGHAIQHAVSRAGLEGAEVEDVALGCGGPEGATGMNVARNAAMWAGLPVTTSGNGVVYRLTPQGELKVLHTFGYALTPTSGLVQGPDGFFYGMTQSGGSNSAGTIYKVSADGTFAQLLEFADAPRTAIDFANCLFGHRPLEGMNLLLATGETLAHVRYLVGTGALLRLEASAEAASTAPAGRLSAYQAASPVPRFVRAELA